MLLFLVVDFEGEEEARWASRFCTKAAAILEPAWRSVSLGPPLDVRVDFDFAFDFGCLGLLSSSSSLLIFLAGDAWFSPRFRFGAVFVEALESVEGFPGLGVAARVGNCPGSFFTFALAAEFLDLVVGILV